jgi:hypothetical protein
MHLSPEELDNQRAAVAQHVFESYDFGSDLDVNDSEQWDNSLSHDRTRTVYADVIGSDDKTRLFLHVQFKDGSADIKDVYALDANSGNLVGLLPPDLNNPWPTPRFEEITQQALENFVPSEALKAKYPSCDFGPTWDFYKNVQVTPKT